MSIVLSCMVGSPPWLVDDKTGSTVLDPAYLVCMADTGFLGGTAV